MQMGPSSPETRRPQHRTTTRRKGSRCCPMVRPLSQSYRSTSTETSLLNRTTLGEAVGLSTLHFGLDNYWIGYSEETKRKCSVCYRPSSSFHQSGCDHHLFKKIIGLVCSPMRAQSVVQKYGGNVLTVSIYCRSRPSFSGLLNSVLCCCCRPGDEHSLRNGDRPIRHDWPPDVYPGSRD